MDFEKKKASGEKQTKNPSSETILSLKGLGEEMWEFISSHSLQKQ